MKKKKKGGRPRKPRGRSLTIYFPAEDLDLLEILNSRSEGAGCFIRRVLRKLMNYQRAQKTRVRI